MDGGAALPGGVRRAEPADLPAVCSALADGFYRDPVWGWAFDDERHRRRVLLAWFDVLAGQGVTNRSVWMTAGGESVAVWVPPGRPEVDPNREAELFTTIRDICGARAELIFELFDVFEANHPHDVGLHYLSLLATSDQHRGHGLGMGLLKQNLEQLDQLGAPAYLESTNPANLDRYQGVGFKPYGGFALPGGGPSVTTMWREPRR